MSFQCHSAAAAAALAQSGCRSVSVSTSSSGPCTAFRAIHTRTACELHQQQSLRALRSGTTTTLYRPHASSDFHLHTFVLVSAPATRNNIPASMHPRFWRLGHLQNCCENSPLQLRLHATPLKLDSHPSAPPIHSSVTYGAN